MIMTVTKDGDDNNKNDDDDDDDGDDDNGMIVVNSDPRMRSFEREIENRS